MNGYVLAHRLVTVAVSAMRTKPTRVTFIGDSECTISAAEYNSAFLKAYLANRVSEVDDLRAELKSQHPEMIIDPPYHTPGLENGLADMATRGGVSISQVQAGSNWQTGFQYLRGPREEWPISRKFVRFVPEEEKRMKVFNLVNVVRVPKSVLDQSEPSTPGLLSRIENVLHYSDSLMKVRGILARLLRMSRFCAKSVAPPSREELKEIAAMDVTVDEYKGADRVMLLLTQSDIREALDKPQRSSANIRKQPVQSMASLQPYKKNGIWVTRGRFGKALKRVLGPDSLPILGPTSRLSQLFIIYSHNQNHMGGGDALFRSRSLAWIVRGRTQSDKVAKNCLKCVRKMKTMMEQQMGDLPVERTNFPDKPWSSTSLDLLGSYEVRAMNNQRSKRKCYPVVCCCMVTGALHVELAHDYGTDAFLCAYSSFVALRSRPAMIYTDQGTQLIKASTYVTEDPSTWDWAAVTKVEAQQGTKWRFCPPGAQFRNGLAEARVKALKHTMELLMFSGASSLNFNEFRCLLTRAANIINDRPLGVRHHGLGVDGELLPITPNLLLLGKNSSSAPDPIQPFDDTEDQFTKRAAFINKLEETWWQLWYVQVFYSLFPLPKWKLRKDNLVIGDIVLVAWESKLGKGQYRMARVVRADQDDKGLVRTATVELRPRDARERSLPYKSKKLLQMTVAVQRLVMICPVGNIPSEDYSSTSQVEQLKETV